MNPEWFGDSFDIVKRFFIGLLKDAGYRVFVEPMFTGKYEEIEESFYTFIGAHEFDGMHVPGEKSALLLDPDTGIGRHKTDQHVTVDDILGQLDRHDIVFSFDQSFSRNRKAPIQMKEKLALLSSKGAFGFYYDSHARFLFVGKSRAEVEVVLNAIRDSGLPERRLVAL